MTTNSSPSKSSSSPLKTGRLSDPSTTSKINSINVRPSAEDLVDLERELHRLISRKNQADIHLATLETRLYDLESEYFTETQLFGNLVYGIEGYLGLPIQSTNILVRKTPFSASSTSLNSVTNHNLSNTINVQNRMFSSTSTTYPESLAISGRLQEAFANGYVPSTNTSVAAASCHPSKKLQSVKKAASSNNSSSRPNINKKVLVESIEWQPPSMKSRKK